MGKERNNVPVKAIKISEGYQMYGELHATTISLVLASTGNTTTLSVYNRLMHRNLSFTDLLFQTFTAKITGLKKNSENNQKVTEEN